MSTPKGSSSAQFCSTIPFLSRIAGSLQPGDFCLEKHQRIFRRMAELNERGEKVDRITLANELLRYNELESV